MKISWWDARRCPGILVLRKRSNLWVFSSTTAINISAVFPPDLGSVDRIILCAVWLNCWNYEEHARHFQPELQKSNMKNSHCVDEEDLEWSLWWNEMGMGFLQLWVAVVLIAALVKTKVALERLPNRMLELLVPFRGTKMVSKTPAFMCASCRAVNLVRRGLKTGHTSICCLFVAVVRMWFVKPLRKVK